MKVITFNDKGLAMSKVNDLLTDELVTIKKLHITAYTRYNVTIQFKSGKVKQDCFNSLVKACEWITTINRPVNNIIISEVETNYTIEVEE